MVESITPVDHEEKGLDRVIDKLDKENFKKNLAIYLDQSQQLEAAFIELAEQKNLQVAKGVWLDYIGAIVGEPRSGKNDEEYRRAIEFRISINTATGTPNNLIDLVKQYTGATGGVSYREGTLSWGSLTIIGDSTIDQLLPVMVDNIRPVSTYIQLHIDVTGESFKPQWIIGTAPPETKVPKPQCGSSILACGDSRAQCTSLYTEAPASDGNRTQEVYASNTKDRNIPAWEVNTANPPDYNKDTPALSWEYQG